MITLKVWSYLTVFILCSHKQKPASPNSQKRKNLHRLQRSWLVICFCIQGSSLHPATSINIAPKDHNLTFFMPRKVVQLMLKERQSTYHGHHFLNYCNNHRIGRIVKSIFLLNYMVRWRCAFLIKIDWSQTVERSFQNMI